MNAITNERPLAALDRLLADETALRTYPPAALWRLWWRIGRALAARSMAVVATWYERARQRRDLRELDLHLLRDIGLTARRAWAEAEKPFWSD